MEVIPFGILNHCANGMLSYFSVFFFTNEREPYLPVDPEKDIILSLSPSENATLRTKTKSRSERWRILV